MIKSMTGFGRYETITEDYRISVEIKSVNHRYCDMNIKLPKKFNEIESNLRNAMKSYASRGKIDVYIGYEDYAQAGTHVHYHEQLAGEYMQAAQKASEDFELSSGMTASALIRFPEVLSIEEETDDLQDVFPVVVETLQKAGEQFAAAREREGESLYEDIRNKLQYLLELVAQVEQRSPEILSEYRKKLTDKVQELLGDRKLDDSVLATELIVYADKVCVDEETVRLRSHIESMQETLEQPDAIGRKLDFIAQEMNREANTILSKANDKELSAVAINLKTEIEKIREQIQNIE
ncbi:MAG: YicC family protein [Lachnospiraceae bacterium]|nr:YicC family protein [Lachnospiraceae bacterium]